MNVSDVAKLAGIDYNTITPSGVNTNNKTAFDVFLDSAMNMVYETDSLQKDAEQAEIRFELGYMDDTTELSIAQQKANIALQYTVAVRDSLVSAYKEIMQLQV